MNPCVDYCYFRLGKQYSLECEEFCDFAKVVKERNRLLEECDELKRKIRKINDYIKECEDTSKNCSNCGNNVEYPPPHTCDICTSLDQEEEYSMWCPRKSC